jgi:hypothetical protein
MHSNAKKGVTRGANERGPLAIGVHHSTSKYINIMVLPVFQSIPKNTKITVPGTLVGSTKVHQSLPILTFFPGIGR